MNWDFNTHARNTWCPGCGNFAILNALKAVVLELGAENCVIVTGIGQHGKISDYANVSSFYSLHGRPIPPAEAIKIADPSRKVIVFSGDGDCYGEGLEHLVFAAKRNIDITTLVHNNRVYALTTGQATPTSPLGFKGRSTPAGAVEKPLNPLALMLAAGATFIARSYTAKVEHLKQTFKAAILHKGFALIDVLQVCVTFNNLYDYYNKLVYELKDNDPANYDLALKNIREWDYNTEAPIAVGTFFKQTAPTFEESLVSPGAEADRQAAINRFLAERI